MLAYLREYAYPWLKTTDLDNRLGDGDEVGPSRLSLFTAQEYSSYSFLLETGLTPRP
jgi:hypothetical protein